MTIADTLLVPGCVALGGVAGALLPAWVARLPEPVPDTVAAEAAPVEVDVEIKTPYAELARWSHLPLAGGVLLALCWGLLAWRLGPDLVLPAVLYLAVAGVLLGYVDLRVRLLPNAVVLPSYLVVAGLLTFAALLSGRWTDLAWALAGGAALWGFLAFLRILAPAGMGGGDVKLGGLLGLCLGWFGLAYVLVGALLAFVLGGLVSLALILTKRARLKSAIPFGPFLLAGFLLAVLSGGDLVGWYLGG